MIGEKYFVTNIQPCGSGHVTFGDGAKGKVVGKGQLNYPRLPVLQDVILVEGLIANLISISKLCDQGLSVNFSKDKCIVTDKDNNTVMSGTRSSDDCYQWNFDLSSNVSNSVRNSEASLWYKRLRHISL